MAKDAEKPRRIHADMVKPPRERSPLWNPDWLHHTPACASLLQDVARRKDVLAIKSHAAKAKAELQFVQDAKGQ